MSLRRHSGRDFGPQPSTGLQFLIRRAIVLRPTPSMSSRALNLVAVQQQPALSAVSQVAELPALLTFKKVIACRSATIGALPAASQHSLVRYYPAQHLVRNRVSHARKRTRP
jgi:hypothetical protein